MKLKLISILVALCAFTFTALSDQKAEEIIENSIKNAGGKEKFDALKTIKFVASVNIPTQGLDLSMQFGLKKPEMMYLKTEVPAMQMKIEAGTDGKMFWGFQPGDSVRKELPKEAVGQIQGQLSGLKNMLNPAMHDYKEKGLKAVYKELADIDEKKCHVLTVTEEDGSTSEVSLDAISNLMYSTKSSIEAQGQNITVEMKVREYQRVEGLTIPKRIEILQNGQVQQKITISDVKFNTEMKDSEFMIN